MATAALYEGYKVQIAKRDDGVWFHRYSEYNGYGVAWTKWTEYKKLITAVDENDKQYTLEENSTEIPNKLLGDFSGNYYLVTDVKVRLPKK